MFHTHDLFISLINHLISHQSFHQRSRESFFINERALYVPIGFSFHHFVPRVLLSYYTLAACRNTVLPAIGTGNETEPKLRELPLLKIIDYIIRILYVASLAFRATSGTCCAYASSNHSAEKKQGPQRKIIACEQEYNARDAATKSVSLV